MVAVCLCDNLWPHRNLQFRPCYTTMPHTTDHRNVLQSLHNCIAGIVVNIVVAVTSGRPVLCGSYSLVSYCLNFA